MKTLTQRLARIALLLIAPLALTACGINSIPTKEEKAKVHDGGCYVAIQGPQFSTRAESLLYRKWGGDVIGMTAMPEARLPSASSADETSAAWRPLTVTMAPSARKAFAMANPMPVAPPVTRTVRSLKLTPWPSGAPCRP